MVKKKAMMLSIDKRRMLTDQGDESLSIREQCLLLGLNRSGLYYEPVGESSDNLLYMKLLDRQYTEDPTYGVERMTWHLRRLGHSVNAKRVRRLLRLMGLEAIYQKPRLSQRHADHHVYPYLLRDIVIERPDHVWSCDITYVPMKQGFAYLFAVIDWYTRFVLGWSVSTTLEADFCIETVGLLLDGERHCMIFNTDQGSQFTTQRFTQPIVNKGILMSMDGKGRALDNIFVERLWRTVKYEYIYLHEFQTVSELRCGLSGFFNRYNHQRLHQSLGYHPPGSIYYGKEKIH
jgi:putative transposase